MPTSYEIYQTYMCGPAAVIRLFEQALGTQALYGPPDPDMQQRTIESLSQDIGRLKSQVARLQEELRETRGDNHRLRQRNMELEALVTKDSHNSSRPRLTRRGLNGPRACGGLRADTRVGSPVIRATRCG